MGNPWDAASALAFCWLALRTAPAMGGKLRQRDEACPGLRGGPALVARWQWTPRIGFLLRCSLTHIRYAVHIWYIDMQLCATSLSQKLNMPTSRGFHGSATFFGIPLGMLGRAVRPAATGCRHRASVGAHAMPASSIVAFLWPHSIFRCCPGAVVLNAQTRDACYRRQAHRLARRVVGTKTFFPIPPWGVRYGS